MPAAADAVLLEPGAGRVARDPQLLRPRGERVAEHGLRGLGRPQHHEDDVVAVARDAELAEHAVAHPLDREVDRVAGGAREAREPVLEELAAPLDEAVREEEDSDPGSSTAAASAVSCSVAKETSGPVRPPSSQRDSPDGVATSNGG